MEELSIPYFRQLLDKNIKELKGFCQQWEDVCSGNTVPEEVCDEIRTTIGLTNLLMCQKLKQFGGLIDDSEFKRGEKEITCVDLQGFWDMVYNEVEKIQKSFKNLEKCQNNNWVFIQEPVHKLESKKKPALANTIKVATAAKAHALAARQRLAEAKLKMRTQFVKKPESTFEVEIASATKDTIVNTLVQEKRLQEIGNSDIDLKQQIIDCEGPTQPKQSLKTIENLHIAEDKEVASRNKTSKKPNKKFAAPQEVLVNGVSKKQKYGKSADKGKENFSKTGNEKDVLTVPSKKMPAVSPPLRAKRGKPKEVIPLQCLTRSAKRAMLAHQNAL